MRGNGSYMVCRLALHLASYMTSLFPFLQLFRKFRKFTLTGVRHVGNVERASFDDRLCLWKWKIRSKRLPTGRICNGHRKAVLETKKASIFGIGACKETHERKISKIAKKFFQDSFFSAKVSCPPSVVDTYWLWTTVHQTWICVFILAIQRQRALKSTQKEDASNERNEKEHERNEQMEIKRDRGWLSFTLNNPLSFEMAARDFSATGHLAQIQDLIISLLTYFDFPQEQKEKGSLKGKAVQSLLFHECREKKKKITPNFSSQSGQSGFLFAPPHGQVIAKKQRLKKIFKQISANASWNIFLWYPGVIAWWGESWCGASDKNQRN